MTSLPPRTPYGYGIERVDFIRVSEGRSPAANLRMAPWLPARIYNQRAEFPIALQGGMLVGIEKESDGTHYYVPTTGGKAIEVTVSGIFPNFASIPSELKYTVLDLGVTINKNTGVVVATGDIGDPTNGYCPLDANAPVGYAFYNWYKDLEAAYQNMQLQTYEKAVMTTEFIEWPVVNAVQNAACPGDLVIPDPLYPGRWRPANLDKAVGLIGSDAKAMFTASGYASVAEKLNFDRQICGRIWTREEIVDVDNLSKETTYPGLGLTGRESLGVPAHLRNAAVISTKQYRVKVQFGGFCR